MAKSTASAGEVLSLFLNNVSLSGYGGNLYASLHTSDPGVGGTQLTNECAYGGYLRVAITRDNSGSGFTTSGTTRTNAAQVQFPMCTGGSETATYLCIGEQTTGGGGKIIYKGALTTPLNISTNITPQFAIAAISITEA